ncbi:hypothetical protein BHM03_00032020 [Ensete ventricosum]|nr:hypothetical protein BHM03_00032020 [Ensete ventricosum]
MWADQLESLLGCLVAGKASIIQDHFWDEKDDTLLPPSDGDQTVRSSTTSMPFGSGNSTDRIACQGCGEVGNQINHGAPSDLFLIGTVQQQLPGPIHRCMMEAKRNGRVQNSSNCYVDTLRLRGSWSKHCWFRPVCASSPAVLLVQSWSLARWVMIQDSAWEVGYWSGGAPVGKKSPSSGQPLIPARRQGRVGSRRDPSDGRVNLVVPFSIPLPRKGRLYDYWRPSYLHPAGCPCRVGHVDGPAVRGYDDMAARSAFVISFPPREDLLEAPDEGAKDEVLCLAADSRSP